MPCESCSILLFLALCTGNLVGALVAPRDARAGVWHRLAALAPGMFAVASPAWLPREWPITRTVIAFAVAGGFLRLVEIVRAPETFVLRQRIAAVLFPFMDPRRIEKGPRGVRTRMIARAALEVAIAVVLFIWVGRFPHAAPYSGLVSVERTLVGGASCYFFVEATGRGVHGLFLSLGIVLEKPHDAPILSRSLGEFWGKRWNRAVGRWLHDNVFRPTAVRAGLGAGVLAAFTVSGLLHFVPLALVCNLGAATSMGSFFILHGVLVILELKLRLARLRPIFGRIVTLGTFAVTAPMFVEPMLQTLGV